MRPHQRHRFCEDKEILGGKWELDPAKTRFTSPLPTKQLIFNSNRPKWKKKQKLLATWPVFFLLLPSELRWPAPMPREAAPADRQPCFHTDAENYRFRAMHGQKQNNRKFRHYLKKTEAASHMTRFFFLLLLPSELRWPAPMPPTDRQPCFHTDAENYRFRAMHGQKQNHRKFRHDWISRTSVESRGTNPYQITASPSLSRSRCRRMQAARLSSAELG